MAELTIFLAYRRRHYTLEAANMILADPHKPEVFRLKEAEAVLIFNVQQE